MRILFLFQDGDVVEFDVEELVDGFEDAFYRKIILEFHCDFLVHQCLEERIEYWPLAESKVAWTYAFGDVCASPRGAILRRNFTKPRLKRDQKSE
jgi:hypothetical protein